MKNCFKTLRLAVLCALLSVSAEIFAQDKPTEGFIIKGNITGAKDGAKVKLFDIDGQRVLDSATITNSAFTLKGHVDKPTTCWVRCDNEYATI